MASWRERLLSLLLPLLLLGHALFLEHSTGADGAVRRDAVVLLADEGRLASSMYSLAGPVFATPLHWLDRLLGTGEWLLSRYNLLLLFVFALVMRRQLRRHGGERYADAFAVLLFAASPLPVSASVFYGEMFSVCTVGLGLHGLAVGWGLGAYALLVLGCVNVPPLLVPLTLVLVLRAWANRSLLPLLALAAVPATILLENWLRRGSPFTTGYESFHYPLLLGALGLLLSPGVGLLPFCPGLCLLPVRREPAGAIDVTLRYWLVFLFGTLLVYAKWDAWCGAVFWGPRFMLLGALPASLLLARHAASGMRSIWGEVALLLALGWSAWACANGSAGLFVDVLSNPDLYLPRGVGLRFDPQLSPLVHVRAPSPEAASYLLLCAIGCILISLPSLRRAKALLPAALRDLRERARALGTGRA